ncbi:MAG: DUF11 domain-containing protein, partial [Candidatus Korarchaeum sp.]|nr:DUF11 domain-containing protein [Candidatus Korarchaeum sp.]
MIRSYSNVSNSMPCSVVKYTSDITFNLDGINSTLSKMSYTHCEEGGIQEDYLGPTYVRLPNGSTFTLEPILINDACFLWNLSELNFVTNRGDELRISYDVRLKCSASSFIHDRVGLYLDAHDSNGDPLGCSGSMYYASYMDVIRPLMSISEVTPPFIVACSMQKRVIHVRGATEDNPGYEVTVRAHVPPGFSVPSLRSDITLANGTSYQVDAYSEGNVLIWNATNFPYLSRVTSDFRISFNMTPCCDVAPSTYRSELHYEDYCGHLGLCDGCTCSHNVSYESGEMMVLRPNLILYKTPSKFSAVSNIIRWMIQISNSGNTSQSDPLIVDELGSGLALEGVELPPGWSYTQDGNTLYMTNETFKQGKTVKINLTARMIRCADLNDEVRLSWGCCSAKCQELSARSRVEVFGERIQAVDRVVPSPVELCGDANVTVKLKNTGASNVYNLTVNYTLPECFYYKRSVGAYVYNSTHKYFFPPNQTGGSWLAWNLSETVFEEMKIGASLNVTFNVTASCPCSDGGGRSRIRISYDRSCGDRVSSELLGASSYRFLKPNLELGAFDIYGERGDLIWWNLTLTNTGEATAKYVNVTVNLPGSLSFVDAQPIPAFIDNGALFWVSERYGGNIPDIAPGGSFKVNISVRVMGCVDRETVSATASSGCEGCVYDGLERKFYIRSRPSPPVIGILYDTINACGNATWRFRITNVDQRIPLRASNYGSYHNYTITNNLTLDVSPMTSPNLESNSRVYFYDGTTTIQVPVYAYGNDPGVAPFAWVRQIGSGIQWQIFMPPSSPLPPGGYFELRYNVTSSNCHLKRGVYRVETSNFADSCGASRDVYLNRRDRVLLPSLSITKTPAFQYGTLRQVVCWSIGVSNSGNGTAHNTTVFDTLSSEFSFYSSSPTPDEVLTLANGSTIVYWRNRGIPSGSTLNINLCANITNPLGPLDRLYDDTYAFWGCRGCNHSSLVHAHAEVSTEGAPINLTKIPNEIHVCG